MNEEIQIGEPIEPGCFQTRIELPCGTLELAKFMGVSVSSLIVHALTALEVDLNFKHTKSDEEVEAELLRRAEEINNND